MNIFTRITANTMKRNPVRTTVTIIGIIIATAMFTAVTTFAISLYDFLYRTEGYDSGFYHVATDMVDMAVKDRLEADNRIEDMAVAKEYGYAYVGSSNDYKPYAYIIGVDNTFLDIMPVHLTEGRMPENDSEIIVPLHLYSNGNVKYELGQVVTFDIGKRYSFNADGVLDTDYTLRQNEAYDDENGETVVSEYSKSYTVVGFYERPDFENYTAPGYTIITYSDTYGGQDMVKLYMALDNVTVTMDAFEDDYKDIFFEHNWSILSYSGQFLYDNFMTLLTMLAAIFVVIIMCGSVSMIYSAFSISVSERTKQFGLLASLGATRKQIMRSVFSEALIVSVIGIPVGIICGIVGIGITLFFVGSKFTYIITSPYSVELVVESGAIIAAAVVAAITVIISAIIPSIRAARVTAIEAIRQSKDIKMPRGKRGITKLGLTYKLFGIEGTLAAKYFKRSRKKYRITIFSLGMSVVLFIATSSYCAYLKELMGINIEDIGYDVSYYTDGLTDPESFAAPLREAKGLKDMMYEMPDYGTLFLNEGEVAESFTKYWDMSYEYYLVEDVEQMEEYVNVLFIDDISYMNYIKKLGLNPADYENLYEVEGLFYNSAKDVFYYHNDEGEYIRYSMKYDIYNEERSEIVLYKWDNDIEDWIPDTRKIAAFADELPDIDTTGNGCTLIYPFSSKYRPDKSIIVYYFTADKYEVMLEDIKNILKSNGYPTDYGVLYDQYKYVQENRNMLLVINVFTYGFITLMTLICVANVFNTISTNIALRRRDFAMLKSVGMDDKGINRMLGYECLKYGIRSLIIGLPVSVLVSYFFWKVYAGAGEFDFYMPWVAIVLAIVGVFVIVAVSMVYAVSKLRKDNPIDSLKQENV